MTEAATLSRAEARRVVVADTIAAVRRIEAEDGATRRGLDRVRDALLRLAARAELFPPAEFPGPRRGEHKDIVFYRLHQDADGGRALYLSAALPGKESPPHDHGNWAVLVGVRGTEVNRLYDRGPDGQAVLREAVAVGPGTGVTLLSEDLHSIHVKGVGDVPVLQLRFYERGLEQQTERSAFGPGGTQPFPPNLNILPVN